MRTSITTLTLFATVLISGVAAAQEATTTTTTSPGYTTAAPAPVAATPATTTTTPVTTTTTPVTTTTTPVTTTTTTSAIVPGGPQTSNDMPAPETRSPINRPLMVTGLILLGGTYGASAIDAAASSRDADKNNLYYPIVGPWMDYANRGGCPATGSCAGETGNKALLILDGIGQGLGAIGIITSLFIPEKATHNWYLIGDGAFHAAPSRVGTGYGLGAGGVF